MLLDIGCGDGFFDRRFFAERCRRIDAIEIEPDSIRRAQRDGNGKIQYHLLDAVNQPFPSEKYDVIVWDAAIGHFSKEGVQPVLQKITPALKEDGVFVGSESLGHEGHDHLQFFETTDDLKRLLTPHFKHVGVRTVEYSTAFSGSFGRQEAFWRCAQGRVSPGRGMVRLVDRARGGKMSIEVLEHGGIKYGEVLRADARVGHSTFFSPAQASFQFGLLAHKAGYSEKPHCHPPIERTISYVQQMFVVQRGVVAVDLYSDDGKLVPGPRRGLDGRDCGDRETVSGPACPLALAARPRDLRRLQSGASAERGGLDTLPQFGRLLRRHRRRVAARRSRPAVPRLRRGVRPDCTRETALFERVGLFREDFRIAGD